MFAFININAVILKPYLFCTLKIGAQCLTYIINLGQQFVLCYSTLGCPLITSNVSDLFVL